MEKSNKIINIGLILIGVTLLICTFFAYYTKLDQPVFLRHYFEYDIQPGNEEAGDKYSEVQLSLQYITNITDLRNVSYVVFQEEPEITFNIDMPIQVFPVGNDANLNMGEHYGRYSLRTINLKASIYDNNEEQGDLELSQASIYFDNGDVVNADVGNIILSAFKPTNGSMICNNSSSSSDGTYKVNYTVNEDITLTSIESPIIDKVNSNFEIKVNGKEVIGEIDTPYRKGETITVSSKYKNPKDILSHFTYYNIGPKLCYTDKEGNTYYERIYFNFFPNYDLGFIKIIKYIKARGES